MTFWVAMYCSGEISACQSAGDSINVLINEDKDDAMAYIIDFTNIESQKRWERRSFQFTVNNPEIEVL